MTPEAIALLDGHSGRTWTYAELSAKCLAASEILRTEFSVIEGDRIAVLANNELEFVALFFALQKLSAVLVPVNFRLAPAEVDYILQDCQPRLVIFENTFATSVANWPGAKIQFSGFVDSLSAVGLATNDFVAEAAPDFFQAHCLSDSEKPAMIMYTSGTTGTPKGAILSQRMLFWNSLITRQRLELTAADSAVIFLPFFHTGGWNVLTTPFLHVGARLVILKKFEPDLVLHLSSDATILFGVPTTMDMMARSAKFAEADLSSLRFAIVGGEPMPVPLIETWLRKGVAIRQGYGLTEFGPNVFSLSAEDALRKIGSIGVPNPLIEAQVVDGNGVEVGANCVGELCLRGPTAMTGYLNNLKATRETMQNGWLHTGDLVRRDEEGYYFVVGRKKDMFISGGENVYPAEVEKVLQRVRGVREAAVIGVPDTRWGEAGRAFVVTDGGLSSDLLRQHCLENLAKFKIPREFIFVDSLPKGDSGKILKSRLKETDLALQTK